jgi:hypothetical protein
LTKSGGKYAGKTCAVISSSVTKVYHMRISFTRAFSEKERQAKGKSQDLSIFGLRRSSAFGMID